MRKGWEAGFRKEEPAESCFPVLKRDGRLGTANPTGTKGCELFRARNFVATIK